MAGKDLVQKKTDVGGRGVHEEVITTHVNADFDALASMIAAKKLYPNATLVFPGSQEKSLRNFFLHSTSYLFNFTKLKRIDLEGVKRLILVDTRQRGRIGKLTEILEKEGLEVHIYDHHPRSEDDIRGSVEVIEEVGAATTILTELIQEKGMTVTPEEATIMCLGIHEDTGSLTFPSTTPRDYRAAAWLAEHGANHNLIADMLPRELSAEQVWLLNDLTKSATTHLINGIEVVIAKVIREEYIADFAILVHKFMEMENLAVIFALAQMEDKVYMVARSRAEEVNVAEIALALGGGGHPQAASATIKKKTLIQVERSLHALLRSRINPSKKARDIMSSPVIQIGPERTIKEAATAMTKYNINVLVVSGPDGRMSGYITRQVVEKAVFFGLGHVQVRDYMNIEFSAVNPEASLKEVQDLIIRNKLRILPVIREDRILGVITRTDLLTVLVGGPVLPDFLYDPKHASHFVRKKNMSAILKERLPRNIIGLLKEFGAVADMLGYNAFVVGGFVRDLLLRHPNLDLDVVIEGDGIRFAHEFEQHHEVRVRSHQKFGTAVLIFPDGFKVDVATARIEYYESPGSPPIVETSSLKMDLYRRDFTINTLAVKLNKRHYGTLIDYFGGQKDIKEKVIRVLHNLSFVEDPTRVFRAIRFEQRFGFKIGKLTGALIRNALKVNAFKDLSGRRLFLELKLLLMEKEPSRAIERMAEFDLLQVLSPGIDFTDELKGLITEIGEVISWYNLLYLEEPFAPWKVYWYGLTSSLDAAAIKGLAKRMQMEDQENRRMVSQRIESQDLMERLFKYPWDEAYELYSTLSQYDTELLLYIMARTSNQKTKKLISVFFTKLKGTTVSLKGRDLKRMGFKPGPIYREILDGLLKARLNHRLSSREDEIEFVREHYGSHLEGMRG